MKVKILVIVLMSFIISSCSDDEEEFNFVGVWNLENINLISSSNMLDEDMSFNETILTNQDCLTESSLSIFPDNTALLKLTSTITNTIVVTDETTNTLEHIVLCENEVEEIELNWISGGLGLKNTDETVTIIPTPTTDAITFINESNTLVFSGWVTAGKLTVDGSTENQADSIFVEIEGEEIEFTNVRFMVFNRS